MKQKMVPADQYKDVSAVAGRYVEALRDGSIAMLDGLFHEDSVTHGTVDGKHVGGGAGNPTADFITMYGKSPDIEAHIDVLDMTPSTAVVRVIMEKDAVGSECTDHLLLCKLDSGWTVVAKVFHQFDK